MVRSRAAWSILAMCLLVPVAVVVSALNDIEQSYPGFEPLRIYPAYSPSELLILDFRGRFPPGTGTGSIQWGLKSHDVVLFVW